MTILVTGGAGFIGANFILYWLKNYPGDFIVNFDKLTYAGNLENLKSVQDKPNYKFIKGDITSKNEVDLAVRNVDWIIHFAAESHVDRSILDPEVFIKTNVLGTFTLLNSACKHKIKRFHHVSTDEVFGSLSLKDTRKFDEKTFYSPRSPYAASKAASDHLVRSYYYTYKLPVTISNCSNNFGPFQFPEKLIALTITNILEGKKVPVYGDGLNVRDWLYVEDHARAIDAIVRNGKLGKAYCVGGLTSSISNLEVVKKIFKIMGKDDALIEFIKDRPGHDRRYAINWNKIKKELNWEPKHDFETYLVSTVKWYQENLEWWKRVKSGLYKEYYKIQYGKV